MSVNKNVDDLKISQMYLDESLSIPDISLITGICRSTIRLHLIKSGVKLRNVSEALNLHPEKLGRKGVRREFTDEWKKNMSESRKKYCEKNSKGKSLKPSGYYEITRGENKGRGLHVIIVEKMIGRPLKKDEVVHHENGIKSDNRPENLKLMTRSEHSKLHALRFERLRSKEGKFISVESINQ